MSLPDQIRTRGLPRSAILAACAAVFAILCGCTVQPLYGNANPSTGAATPAGVQLQSIGVAPVGDRVAQEVRNHLIFLLHGGTPPAQTRYEVALNVSAYSAPSASIQVGRDEEPTAATVSVSAGYILTDSTTGIQVAAGARSAMASFDVSRQQFAALRAERDAQNRAAREAAELLRMALAQELAKLSTR